MVNGWRASSKGEKKLVLLGQFLVLASVSADTGVLCDMWVLLKVKKAFGWGSNGTTCPEVNMMGPIRGRDISLVGGRVMLVLRL